MEKMDLHFLSFTRPSAGHFPLGLCERVNLRDAHNPSTPCNRTFLPQRERLHPACLSKLSAVTKRKTFLLQQRKRQNIAESHWKSWGSCRHFTYLPLWGNSMGLGRTNKADAIWAIFQDGRNNLQWVIQEKSWWGCWTSIFLCLSWKVIIKTGF